MNLSPDSRHFLCLFIIMFYTSFSQISRHFRALAFFFKNSVAGQIIAYFCKLLRPNSSKNRSKTTIPTTNYFTKNSFNCRSSLLTNFFAISYAFCGFTPIYLCFPYPSSNI